MRAVYKYKLELGLNELPVSNVQWLSVGIQGDQLCIWGVVDTQISGENYAAIYVAATGENLPYGGRMDRESFIGRITQGPYEWHVFSVPHRLAKKG